MYIRIYVRIYIRIRIHTVRICTYVRIRTYIHVYIHLCINEGADTCTYENTETAGRPGPGCDYSIRTYVRINTSTYMQRIHCNWHGGADTYEP